MKTIVILILALLSTACASTTYATAWPTDDITTTHVDQATDDPSQARAEIYTAMQRVKDIIAAYGSASGVAPLDASSLVPLANIPATLTGKSADTVDGYNPGTGAGNLLILDGSGLVPLANIPATLTGKSADTVDGYNPGNASGNIPLSNGTVNTNLNADKVDGYNASNATASVPISNGTVNTNLNADMVDGYHATSLAKSGANTDITSLTGLTGSVSSAKSCATGFARVTPNECMDTNRNLGGTLLTSGVCTAFAAPSASAKWVLIGGYAVAVSAGSAAYRYSVATVYSNSSCTSPLNSSDYLVSALSQETTAWPGSSGKNIASDKSQEQYYLPSAGATIYIEALIDAGGNGTLGVNIDAYGD